MRLAKKYGNKKCPDREIFIKAFLKEASLGEKERLIDHIFSCEKCRLRFEAMKQLLDKLGEAEKEFEGMELSAGEERQFRRMAKQEIKGLERNKTRYFFCLVPARYIAAAAALLIIVAGLFFILKKHPGEAYREVEKEKLSLVEPVGKIRGSPSLFIWTEVKRAESYDFELIDEELTVIYTKSTSQTQLTLPASVREKLSKGRTYIWKIEAHAVFGRYLDSKRAYFEIE